jgi:hypothetical protein
MVAVVLRIQVVSGSNLRSKKGYADVLPDISRSLQENTEIVAQNRRRLLHSLSSAVHYSMSILPLYKPELLTASRNI